MSHVGFRLVVLIVNILNELLLLLLSLVSRFVGACLSNDTVMVLNDKNKQTSAMPMQRRKIVLK